MDRSAGLNHAVRTYIGVNKRRTKGTKGAFFAQEPKAYFSIERLSASALLWHGTQSRTRFEGAFVPPPDKGTM